MCLLSFAPESACLPFPVSLLPKIFRTLFIIVICQSTQCRRLFRQFRNVGFHARLHMCKWRRIHTGPSVRVRLCVYSSPGRSCKEDSVGAVTSPIHAPPKTPLPTASLSGHFPYCVPGVCLSSPCPYHREKIALSLFHTLST